MLIRLVYQKCIKNGLTGNDIPSPLLYCLASRNTRNLWMMTSHSKKKRESRKVDQKQERWTRKVDQKLERPFCNLYPRTQVSLRAKWPTDWISTGVLYLSILRGCKTTTWFVARGHRSLVAGLSYNKKKVYSPHSLSLLHCYIVTFRISHRASVNTLSTQKSLLQNLSQSYKNTRLRQIFVDTDPTF